MAEMTSAHAIERAEHALRTGQPNLAMIYMRRASVLVAEDHAAARRTIRRALIARATPFELVFMGLKEAFDAVQKVVDAFVKTVAEVNVQNQYALAGPSKGGTDA